MILAVRIWFAQMRVDYLRWLTDQYRWASYEFARRSASTGVAFGWAHANLMCLLNRKKN